MSRPSAVRAGRWLLVALVMGLELTGCDLSPQPLPPGSTFGNNAGSGSGGVTVAVSEDAAIPQESPSGSGGGPAVDASVLADATTNDAYAGPGPESGAPSDGSSAEGDGAADAAGDAGKAMGPSDAAGDGPETVSDAADWADSDP